MKRRPRMKRLVRLTRGDRVLMRYLLKRDRWLVIRVISHHPRLTVAEAIRDLRDAGGL